MEAPDRGLAPPVLGSPETPPAASILVTRSTPLTRAEDPRPGIDLNVEAAVDTALVTSATVARSMTFAMTGWVSAAAPDGAMALETCWTTRRTSWLFSMLTRLSIPPAVAPKRVGRPRPPTALASAVWK